jgi:hypothetical protein
MAIFKMATKVFINNQPVSDAAATATLMTVSQKPQAFGLNPKSIVRKGDEVHFTFEQVVKVLNPANPNAKTIDQNDFNKYKHLIKTNAFTESNFAGLALDIQKKFPDLLAKHGIKVDNKWIHQVFEPEIVLNRRMNALTKTFFEKAADPDLFLDIHIGAAELKEATRLLSYYLSKNERNFDIYIFSSRKIERTESYIKIAVDVLKKEYPDLNARVIPASPPADLKNGDLKDGRRVIIF